MINFNNKNTIVFTVWCLFLLFIGMAAGFILASNRQLLPSSLSNYLPEASTTTSNDSILSQLNKKPVAGVFISISGKVKTISATVVSVELQGESVSLKIDPTAKPYLITLVNTTQPVNPGETPATVTPTELSWSEVKVGDQVSIAASLTGNELVVSSLMITAK